MELALELTRNRETITASPRVVTWTLDRANAALFQVQGLLREAKAKAAALQTAPSEASKDELLAVLQQFENLGIQVKSIEPGLLDFPALLGNREVLLCWQEGEPEIGHYHDLEGGFAGRRPIPSVAT